ncbi:head-tail connector protein [Clostridium sp.]|uniref:head-tail connector protein n=1 Tax=Clostridium sp. TaxID=1506 RepID=UPI00283C0A79|nr:head-tail connector protein [Clostridium sp.]MDR3595107.1 head-tail connector protein [Clostridium sp.]
MPLTTLENVKSYLRLTDTSDDSFINLLIADVQATVENYCHRHFDVNTYTSEQHNINHKIFPKETPIKDVTSIIRLDDNIDNTVPDNNWVNNYRLFPSYVELLDYKYVTMGDRLKYVNSEQSYVEITYTAGYDTPPADLSLAATKLVVLEYKDSRENRLGVEQEREGDVQYTYSKKDSEMPLNISSVLDRYKRVSL